MWWIEGVIVVAVGLAYLKLRAISKMLDGLRKMLQLLSAQHDDVHHVVCPTPLDVPDEYLLDVVRQACQRVGLNGEQITSDFKISSTGKLNEVLHFSAQTLNQPHPVATIRDVVKVLSYGRN